MISVVNGSKVFDENGMLILRSEALRADTVAKEIGEYVQTKSEFTAWDVRTHVLRKYGDWSKEYVSELSIFLARMERFGKIQKIGKRGKWVLYGKTTEVSS